MQNFAVPDTLSESQFAELVDTLAADQDPHDQLIDLLREEHSLYNQRGAATIVRMRGWVLIALARVGVSDAALVLVLEELATGTDAYLVAAAAHALRSYPGTSGAFAPFVMRALTRIRFHDEPVSLEKYGEYSVASDGTSAVRELLATLAWLGPQATGVLDELDELRKQSGGLSRKLLIEVDRAVAAIRATNQGDEVGTKSCCTLPTGLRNTSSWSLDSRRDSGPIEQTVFEDQDGASITFREFFRGHPSIVVFFYTRCDNPLKCSLTVTKLGRIQELLEARGFADDIHTAAITYDPEYDLPERIRGYGKNRDVRMDARHRMLRTRDGIEALRSHFELGVNFVESLVNRHRVELYVLDAEGRTAASFERIHWDELEVVERAIEVLKETIDERATVSSPGPDDRPSRSRRALPVL